MDHRRGAHAYLGDTQIKRRVGSSSYVERHQKRKDGCFRTIFMSILRGRAYFGRRTKGLLMRSLIELTQSLLFTAILS